MRCLKPPSTEWECGVHWDQSEENCGCELSFNSSTLDKGVSTTQPTWKATPGWKSKVQGLVSNVMCLYTQRNLIILCEKGGCFQKFGLLFDVLPSHWSLLISLFSLETPIPVLGVSGALTISPKNSHHVPVQWVCAQIHSEKLASLPPVAVIHVVILVIFDFMHSIRFINTLKPECSAATRFCLSSPVQSSWSDYPLCHDSVQDHHTFIYHIYYHQLMMMMSHFSSSHIYFWRITGKCRTLVFYLLWLAIIGHLCQLFILSEPLQLIGSASRGACGSASAFSLWVDISCSE